MQSVFCIEMEELWKRAEGSAAALLAYLRNHWFKLSYYIAIIPQIAAFARLSFQWQIFNVGEALKILCCA